MEKVKLFCLPFAGGSRYSYRTFEEMAPSSIEILPLEYPGRGSRTRETLLTNIEDLVTDVYEQVKNCIGTAKYAIYGHSMGGLLACLLARKLVANQNPAPVHLFVTGTSGPSATSRQTKSFHLLQRPDFFAEVRKLNGGYNKLGDNELMDFFEPILRADFKASETYRHEVEAPLPIPFTIVTGIEEEIEIEDIALWQNESAFVVEFDRVPGHHFFIFDYPDVIMNIFTNKLLKYFQNVDK